MVELASRLAPGIPILLFPSRCQMLGIPWHCCGFSLLTNHDISRSLIHSHSRRSCQHIPHLCHCILLHRTPDLYGLGSIAWRLLSSIGILQYCWLSIDTVRPTSFFALVGISCLMACFPSKLYSNDPKRKGDRSWSTVTQTCLFALLRVKNILLWVFLGSASSLQYLFNSVSKSMHSCISGVLARKIIVIVNTILSGSNS